MTATPISPPPADPTLELARFNDETLIDGIIQLTHSIHTYSRTRPERADELRARRAVAKAELLRRLADR